MYDHEIVALYWERNETAVSATADKYGKYCHTISYNILNSEQDAEECVNDTWLGAWKSMPPQRPRYLAAYLGKIVRNCSLDRFRMYTAEKRRGGQAEIALSELKECIPSSVTIEQIVDEHMLADSINRFLYAQPQQKRNIFIRRYWYLNSIREIAVGYGISESKVTSQLFRIRKELKRHLEEEGIAL
ncbi:MAG: sigma-70 family RNA polymerase sigma factor [Oscillospiraceae bacterium]|nr:sigma-70 family RNA polymerase sigma factor [Oscillospiraceae bacterium]